MVISSNRRRGMTAANWQDILPTLPSAQRGTSREMQDRRRRVARAIAAIALPAFLSACADSFVEKDVGAAPLSCENKSREAHRWRPGCATHRNIVAAMADPADLYLARAGIAARCRAARWSDIELCAEPGGGESGAHFGGPGERQGKPAMSNQKPPERKASPGAATPPPGGPRLHYLLRGCRDGGDRRALRRGQAARRS